MDLPSHRRTRALLCLLAAGTLSACAWLTDPEPIGLHDLSLFVDQPGVGSQHSECAVELRFVAPNQLPVPYGVLGAGLVFRRVITATSETIKSATLDSVQVQVARQGSDTVIYLTGDYSDTLNISGSDPSWYCTERVSFARDSALKAAGYPDPLTARGHIRYARAPEPL